MRRLIFITLIIILSLLGCNNTSINESIPEIDKSDLNVIDENYVITTEFHSVIEELLISDDLIIEKDGFRYKLNDGYNYIEALKNCSVVEKTKASINHDNVLFSFTSTDASVASFIDENTFEAEGNLYVLDKADGFIELMDDFFSTTDPIHEMNGKIFAELINVREHHSINSEVIDVLPINSIVKIYETYNKGDNDYWYKLILANGQIGWIAGWYCATSDIGNEYAYDFEVIDDSLEFDVFHNLNEYYVANFPRTYIINIDMDLDDTNESIHIEVKDRNDVKIHYKDSSLQYDFEHDGIGSIGFIDADKNDKYKELVITTDSIVAPQAETSLYRIIDDNIVKTGEIGSSIKHVDGTGKIYYWGGQLFESASDTFDYNEVISYYDIVLNKKVEVTFPIGNTFKLDRKIVVFESIDDAFDNIWEMMDFDPDKSERKYIEILELGESFKVLSYDQNDMILIELPDGRKGYITGFHFYID